MKQVKRLQRAVVLGSTLLVAALLMVAGAVRPLAQARGRWRRRPLPTTPSRTRR